MAFRIGNGNFCGGSLLSPFLVVSLNGERQAFALGEGQREGARHFSWARPGFKDNPHPLTPTLSAWERELPCGSGIPPQPAPACRHDQQGFTLIEMLISLTVMAVILLLTGGALRVMGRNWDANAGRIEMLDMVSRAFDLLARDAANLQRIILPSGTPAYLFSGRPDGLTFVALEPPQPGEAGLYFVAYSVEPTSDGAELIRSRAPWRQGMDSFPGASPANRVPLLTGPYIYRFAYGGIIGGTHNWSGEWTAANRLPDLIRLEVLDRSGARALAPPMIVRLRADAELDCLAPQPPLCSARTGGQLQQAKTGDPQPPERRQR
jgi:general secretion pathway protein J